MVVGDGMMAQAFSSFHQDSNTIIFASGVSNSLEKNPASFTRERELLDRIRAENPDTLLVYLGTCSVYDPDRRDTPYVRHKLAMESVLAAAGGPWLVLRLPLAIGSSHRSQTLAQFLYDRISLEEPFEVWTNAVRFPLDVQDGYRIATRFINNREMWYRHINIALRAFSVLDIVRAMEKIIGKKANYTLVQKGQGYNLNCPEVVQIAGELNLDFSEQYLEHVLDKYFAHR